MIWAAINGVSHLGDNVLDYKWVFVSQMRKFSHQMRIRHRRTRVFSQMRKKINQKCRFSHQMRKFLLKTFENIRKLSENIQKLSGNIRKYSNLLQGGAQMIAQRAEDRSQKTEGGCWMPVRGKNQKLKIKEQNDRAKFKKKGKAIATKSMP